MAKRKPRTPRVSRFVTDLSTFPREIVQRIMSHLPLKTILDLASHCLHREGLAIESTAYIGLTEEALAQASYFDQCVKTHLDLRRCFSSMDDYFKLVSVWSTWRKTLWRLERKEYRPGRLFHRPISVAKVRHSSTLARVLVDSICETLKRSRSGLLTLRLHTTEELPSYQDSKHLMVQKGGLTRPWSNVVNAAADFNELR